MVSVRSKMIDLILMLFLVLTNTVSSFRWSIAPIKL